ncbi:hypothetical protein C1N80_00770 [Brachybacterium sp. SGAir0954]|uniref:hypothetical protein n=1 Tax=Brachybacterium sp. SGAir0954 TaxID=2571029 RepID=UPI0010CD6985|nr:hypothetical protein [Brachybacterium sp. SGAir0954]QCR52256.1 hypothetical protein C1N80_00770 [Brachybacterium sp. SGAir0954]
MTLIDHSDGAPAADAPRPAPRPWFLGDVPVPEAVDPDDPEGRALLRSQLPAFDWPGHLQDLLDFVGEGRRVTRTGTFYVADVRAYRRGGRCPARRRDRWSTWDPAPGLDERARMLRGLGWVEIVDHVLQPTALCPDREALRDAAGTAMLQAMRDGLAAILAQRLQRQGHDLWLRAEDSPREPLTEALLLATRPEGLLLPWAPMDGDLDHCRQVCEYLAGLLQHPAIRSVPLDPYTGHPHPAALRELAHLGAVLEDLVRWGVLSAEGGDPELERSVRAGIATRYRAPLVLRAAIAEVEAGMW